jgi:hypothetical protein
MGTLSSQQLRKLSEVMKSGFMDYAATHGDRMRIGSVTDSPEKNTALIRSYGLEFVRILDGQTEWTEELPPLREDLFILIEKGCPKLDIIQLTFACTRGRSLTISDTLESIGLGGPSFDILAQLCELVSDKIAALDNPSGPVHCLSQLLPQLPDNADRARLVEQLRSLPELLGFYGGLLRLYPPKKDLRTQLEPIQKDYELILLYNLLQHYGLGFPTLSRLLMAMRWVRFRISPKARYVRRFGRVRVNKRRGTGSEAGEKAVRDPFGVAALQRRLHRFSKEHKNWQVLFIQSVLRYLSDEWSMRRASGETLLDLVPDILGKPMNNTMSVIVSPVPLPQYERAR